MTPTDDKLREAAVLAFMNGENNLSLMQLEGWGGPACGAAGSAVRKWPENGVLRGLFRLRWVRNGRRSEVNVVPINVPPHP